MYVRNGPGMSQTGKQSPLTNVAWVLFQPGVVTGMGRVYSRCTRSKHSSVFHCPRSRVVKTDISKCQLELHLNRPITRTLAMAGLFSTLIKEMKSIL